MRLKNTLFIIATIFTLLNFTILPVNEYDTPISIEINNGKDPNEIGKEMFIAIHSGIGSSKYNLPKLIERPPLSTKEEENWSAIIKALDEYGYNFKDFLDKITSGNPYIVESALFEGTHLLIGPSSNFEYSEPTACGPTFCIGLVVVVAVAAVVSTLAAGYNYAAGVNVVVKALVWTVSESTSHNILREDNIAIIARSLG